jgi:histidinol phosphatase-like PHP family hydrolase
MFLNRTFVDVDQLDNYILDLRRVAGQFDGQISVLAGIEIDWSARARPKLAALLEQIDRLDYALFEYVEDLDWHGDSLESLLTLRSRISIPVGLAHNHLSKNFAPYYSVKELVRALQDSDVFVELSTNPLTTYYADTDPYNIRLWQALAESSVRFSIGSDTHGFAADVARVENAYRFLENRGLQKQLITEWWNRSQHCWIGIGERQISDSREI